MPTNILSLNAGSSSIKVSLTSYNGNETVIARGEIERIGLETGAFNLLDWNGNWLVNKKRRYSTHEDAFEHLFDWLLESGYHLDGIGHRIVHGGPRHRSHCVIDDSLIEELNKATSFNPLHLPSEILGIEMGRKKFPKVPQAACFDTAFHSTLPDYARKYALPRHFAKEGMFRYGFHGLSYEYIMQELGEKAREKIIIAHLGNGASLAAVKDKECLDTTMGFTPAEGLMMGTRSGDLDPGLLIYLAAQKRMTPDELRNLVNRESGLKGVSELSSDVKELLEAKNNPKAEEALTMFCYRVRKAVGAFFAALGGCDQLIFTAGIGERAAEVRERICSDLGALGIKLNPQSNRHNDPMISSDKSSTEVIVMRTNEELMIARHTHQLLTLSRGANI